MEDKKFSWYMISTVSGKEDKVVESLKNRIVSEQVEDCFDMNATENGPFKIFKKPTISKTELKKRENGDPYKVKYINIYNGYIFIHMDMTDKAWFVIRNTQYVTGLIGSSGKGAKPTQISIKQIRKSFEKEDKYMYDFKMGIFEDEFFEGDIVEILSGPFKGETGKIINLNNQKREAEVEMESVGRKITVFFEFKLLKNIDK
ncbi:transcription termination/antitermination protein NusG [Mycoplasmopsis meleagridis]|uniref:transcription termination/antitermination protein NusG n=1 Tax=Mycoplasmopsis meleagridis TaxID=29561 RepID=UPI00073D4A6F|nr:transcription termination/antitermination protein NusG [Mycoplasmopsis meleagridis]KUH47618.1 antitermination protein NusG [Mycoplasmopsis meleagridis]